MADMKCGFCQGTTFALSTEQVENARFPLSIVRCTSCDAPVGLLQADDPVAALRLLAQGLGDRFRQLEERLSKEIAEIRDRLPPAAEP
jgi:hypothetical protein